ncbi:MAG TPA: DHA2 family efflux MFS transporter permease subunit [Novosphingobium sp.]|nr:DHA2 family efflux MFS transporter permease subunit [Novosphingobium sp.]
MARSPPAPANAASSPAAPTKDWPLSPRAQLIAGVAAALTNFMVVLDLTIANVSVPHIAGNLGTTLEQGAWIITSYAVAEAICVPLSGWLSDRFGVVRVFLGAMLGFGLFSFVCGISLSLGMLVAARVGQGLCGAPLMPMTQAVMLRIFPPERRAKALSLWAITVMLGPALGPIVGGFISDNYSWHWIFLINVPIAAGCAVVGGVLLPRVESPTVRKPIDRVGLVLLIFWIGCLQLLLDLGRDRGWFEDPFMLSLGIGSLIGFAAFIIWELTEEHPVVDLKIFRHRVFSVSAVALALSFGAYFGGIVVIPQWLQTTQGYTAQQAGMVVAINAVSSITMAVILPRFIERVDLRIFLSFGIFWFSTQAFVRSGWTTGLGFWQLATPQLVQGFGLAMFMIPVSQMSLGSVLPHEIPGASGLHNFMRTISIAIATSLSLTVWNDQARVNHNALADAIQPDAAIGALAQQGVGPEVARTVINNLVDDQAITMAMDHLFIITTVIGIATSALIWLAPRPVPLKKISVGH